MKVKDAMHKGATWVAPTTPVTEVAKRMRESDIGAIPVKAEGHLKPNTTTFDGQSKTLSKERMKRRETSMGVLNENRADRTSY